jgi:hypothetical protein
VLPTAEHTSHSNWDIMPLRLFLKLGSFAILQLYRYLVGAFAVAYCDKLHSPARTSSTVNANA